MGSPSLTVGGLWASVPHTVLMKYKMIGELSIHIVRAALTACALYMETLAWVAVSP